MINEESQLVILDLGSQYTQIIARELLRLGFKSVILRPENITSYLKLQTPKGIILSGGSASVYDANAPQIPHEVFSSECPILGICYGMQYLAYREDLSIVRGDNKNTKEYGPIDITLSESVLFTGLPQTLKVWASHGDVVSSVPKGYSVIAKSASTIEAIENSNLQVYGVQFHPEVIESNDDNKILWNFASLICKCNTDWEPKDNILMIQNKVVTEVGEGRAAIGVSGGVDSTTLAALLSPILQNKIYPFFIDTGGMRHNEVEEVKMMCDKAGIHLEIIDAKNEFLESIGNSIDAEDKRSLFKNTYEKIIKKFIEENQITHILQGTLATDLIESGQLGQASVIKSHHNVGLDFGVIELMPFAHLFKHEVRALARTIGLDSSISERKPFPGPGLYIRIVGVPISSELLEKVRSVDRIVDEILRIEPFYNEISQVVVALLGTKTVGVKGDSRSYEYPIVVRVVSTTDFMTVNGFELPSRIRHKIIASVTGHGFNRVFFDETSKPPATTELE